MDVLDYMRCSIENRVTLLGYSLLCAGATGMYAADRPRETLASVVLAATGAVTAASAEWARKTLSTYRLAQKKIRLTGGLPRSVQRSHKFYCEVAGLRLAAREAGLQDQILARRPLLNTLRKLASPSNDWPEGYLRGFEEKL